MATARLSVALNFRDGENFAPRVQAKNFVERVLTRDMFPVANLLVKLSIIIIIIIIIVEYL